MPTASATFGRNTMVIIAYLLSSCLTPRPGMASDSIQFAMFCDPVLAGMQENREKLATCKIVWKRETREDNFTPGQIAETTGKYELWRKGANVATRSMEEKLYADETGELSKGTSGQRTAFTKDGFRVIPNEEAPDSIALLNEPKYRYNENWLEIIAWHAPSFISDWREGNLPNSLAIDECFIGETDGENFCRIVARETKTGEQMVLRYNLSKGCSLEREEWLDSQGRIRYKLIHRLERVQQDCWLPVEVTKRSIDPDSGETNLLNHYEVDLDLSSFGDDEAVPDSVFEIPITPEMRVVDYRVGKPVLYSGRTTPLPIDELRVKAEAH